MREALVAIHTFLYFIQVTIQVARLLIELELDKQPDEESLTVYRLLKAYYIISGIMYLVNILIMLLFFYMAIQFSGKSLTGYQESLERLQKLQMFAAEQSHTLRKRSSSLILTMQQKA